MKLKLSWASSSVLSPHAAVTCFYRLIRAFATKLLLAFVNVATVALCCVSDGGTLQLLALSRSLYLHPMQHRAKVSVGD